MPERSQIQQFRPAQAVHHLTAERQFLAEALHRKAACIAHDVKDVFVDGQRVEQVVLHQRSEEHTSELQSLMRISYAVFCLKKKTNHTQSDTAHTYYY